jgi:hypothetical protein
MASFTYMSQKGSHRAGNLNVVFLYLDRYDPKSDAVQSSRKSECAALSRLSHPSRFDHVHYSNEDGVEDRENNNREINRSA